MTNTTPIPPLSLATFLRSPMSLSTPNWWESIPAVPGWYAIETDAPLSIVLRQAPPPEGAKHYNLRRRTSDASFLLTKGLAISPSSSSPRYVIYSGEHANLKARAREHTHGHTGTGCLCLHQYKPLHRYDWVFLFRTCDEHSPGCEGNKALRIFLEQQWRGANGWPVLCKQ